MTGLRDRSGFTLVEIILAILVVSIAVLGVASAISFTTQRSLNAEVASTAKELAQEEMERLMAVKRNSGYSDPTLDQAIMLFNPLAVPYNNYSRGVEICLVDANLGNPDCDPTAPNSDIGYKRVTVSVNYSGLPDLASPVASLVTVVTNVRE